METTKPTGKYWLYFLISLIALALMIFFAPKFFWVVLPFTFTFFVRGHGYDLIKLFIKQKASALEAFFVFALLTDSFKQYLKKGL